MKGIDMNTTRRAFVKLGGTGLAATFLALVGCSGAGDDAAEEAEIILVEEGTLTVIFSNGYPPFEFSTDDGSDVQGFDIDLIKAVAEGLGLECNILPSQKFDTLVPTIKAGGKADVCISALTITDARKEEIDFTDPYIDSNLAILAHADSDFASIEDFDKEEVTVVASAGTFCADWAEENLTHATFKPLDDYVSCFTGCESGLYDAVIADLPVAEYLCTTSYNDLKVCAEIPTGDQYGIAVSKDNPALTAAINEVLAQLEADGTMDELKIKWFGTTEGL